MNAGVVTVRLGFSRAGLELRQFLRNRDAVVFSLAFPVVLLALLGTIFTGDGGLGVSASQLLAGGMIASAVLSTSFVTFAVGLVIERENGGLKRLRGTPLPPVAYFLGKVVLVAATGLAEIAVMLVIGVGWFGLRLPGLAGWLTFGWVFALSTAGCALLGIAFSSLIRSADSAGPMVSLPVYALQFVSGVFVTPITVLPPLMVTVAAVFPVKWMAQGFRSVFLPEHAAALELAGSWELGRVALVLGAWCAAGLALCLATFRWTPRGER
jgi:ABC-2 type transport system permease protein